jgi:hypothetical protein
MGAIARSHSGAFGLTARQLDCFNFIDTFMFIEGKAPSYREIAEGIGDVLGGAAVSIGNVHRLVNCLVKRGWITHIPEHARSMTIIRSPWSLSPAPVKEGVEA